MASRLPVGNPRSLGAYSPGYLITRLAWYDRDVVAALHAPRQVRLDQSDGDELAAASVDFQAWSLFDPCPRSPGSRSCPSIRKFTGRR